MNVEIRGRNKRVSWVSYLAVIPGVVLGVFLVDAMPLLNRFMMKLFRRCTGKQNALDTMVSNSA